MRAGVVPRAQAARTARSRIPERAFPTLRSATVTEVHCGDAERRADTRRRRALERRFGQVLGRRVSTMTMVDRRREENHRDGTTPGGDPTTASDAGLGRDHRVGTCGRVGSLDRRDPRRRPRWKPTTAPDDDHDDDHHNHDDHAPCERTSDGQARSGGRCVVRRVHVAGRHRLAPIRRHGPRGLARPEARCRPPLRQDRKSTRLNSSHRL